MVGIKLFEALQAQRALHTNLPGAGSRCALQNPQIRINIFDFLQAFSRVRFDLFPSFDLDDVDESRHHLNASQMSGCSTFVSGYKSQPLPLSANKGEGGKHVSHLLLAKICDPPRRNHDRMRTIRPHNLDHLRMYNADGALHLGAYEFFLRVQTIGIHRLQVL